MLLSVSDVQRKGLQACAGCKFEGKSNESRNEQFHAHYGSSPYDLANIWYDLTETDIPGAALTASENNETGFIMFLVAHYFLWNYPRNSQQLASRFNICERYARGEPVWKWIQKIAALKEKKIVWQPGFDDPHSAIFFMTIDGTDFRMWEKKHPTLPLDRQQCSHKFNHGAVKYEIGMSVFDAKCVWISGPHRGGKHDLTVWREGLKARMPPGKRAIVDRGYDTSAADERMLSQPRATDTPQLHNFKSRARLRHETFNGRLKFFKCLSDTFKHGIDKHKFAFEAVCVIVQYQMDNGSPIFAV